MLCATSLGGESVASPWGVSACATRSANTSNRERRAKGFLFWPSMTESEQETAAIAAVRSFSRKNRDLLRLVWRWGDGYGAGILEAMAQEIDLPVSRDSAVKLATQFKKKSISPRLRKSVMERDAYRCVNCGSHKDLGLDHIFPESKGGLTVERNLQVMCRPCNSRKGTKT